MINFDHSCEKHVHLDGTRVQLDEKYALCRNAQFVHAQIRTCSNSYMLKFVHTKTRIKLLRLCSSMLIKLM